jgi:pre-mRNA cleavage complex 2 protein Pcf11
MPDCVRTWTARASEYAIENREANLDKVPPARTLPALYVLDSVVKNVPTPYALYFGPKLYSIFMGAYTKVDNGTRRKMDEMLKTWKEPVPGSISTKPVFPLEQVRPIENALMAARNVAFAAHQNSYQGQQQLMRGRQPVPSRDTPTPPTGRSYQPPPQQQQQPPYPPGPNGHRPDAQQPYPVQPVSVSVPCPLVPSVPMLTMLAGPNCNSPPCNTAACSVGRAIPVPAAGRGASLWRSQTRNKHRQVER